MDKDTRGQGVKALAHVTLHIAPKLLSIHVARTAFRPNSSAQAFHPGRHSAILRLQRFCSVESLANMPPGQGHFRIGESGCPSVCLRFSWSKQWLISLPTSFVLSLTSLTCLAYCRQKVPAQICKSNINGNAGRSFVSCENQVQCTDTSLHTRVTLHTNRETCSNLVRSSCEFFSNESPLISIFWQIFVAICRSVVE